MNEDDLERVLDQALEATFPASDPLALATVAERWRLARQETPAQGDKNS